MHMETGAHDGRIGLLVDEVDILFLLDPIARRFEAAGDVPVDLLCGTESPELFGPRWHTATGKWLIRARDPGQEVSSALAHSRIRT